MNTALIAQGIVLLAFIALGFVATRSFNPESRTRIFVS